MPFYDEKNILFIYNVNFSLFFSAASHALELPARTDVPLDKAWQIKFNLDLSPDSVNADNIYTSDSLNNKIDSVVKIGENPKIAVILP